MNRKSIIIAISLLLMAGAIIILNRQDKSRATAPGTNHTASQISPGALSKPTPGSAVKEKDQELVARYGEAKTKQARKIAAASISLLRTDTRMTRMQIKELSSESGIAGDDLVMRLDLRDTGIKFSDAQSRKVLELYRNHINQCADRADEAFKVMESKPGEMTKFLLASDACAQGQGDTDEYIRLRSSLEEQLKTIPAFLSKGVVGLGTNVNRWERPLDSPEFHGEFVKLLDPEQTAALDVHLKQRAAQPQSVNDAIADKTAPRSLDNVQSDLDSDAEFNTALGEMMEAARGLDESRVLTEPATGQ